VSRWSPPTWDDERIALAKKAVTPPTASAAEFEFFIAWCKRTSLDPFIKQAYLVERRSKSPSGEWMTKHEPMAAEAGMAALADAQGDFAGIKCATVYAGDKFAIDEDAQRVTHQWDLESRSKAGHRVLGAWAHAQRHGRVVPIVWLPIEARIQTRFDRQKNTEEPTSFWKKDPSGMIAKCARAMSWRLAYPNLFSGVFIPEEMRDDDDVVDSKPTPALPTGPVVSRTAEVAAKVIAKIGGTIVQRPPEPMPAPTPPGPAATPPVNSDEPVVQRGTHKGKPLAGLEAAELNQAIAEHTAGLAKTTEPSARKQVEGWLAALRGEQQKRMDEAVKAEPGADFGEENK
jgi:phage recombination protein Bet